MDHPKRSFFKALTWRGFGFFATLTIVLIYSKDIKEAFMVSGAVEAIKILLYYLHERFWNKLHFGRVKHPDYQI